MALASRLFVEERGGPGELGSRHLWVRICRYGRFTFGDMNNMR